MSSTYGEKWRVRKKDKPNLFWNGFRWCCTHNLFWCQGRNLENAYYNYIRTTNRAKLNDPSLLSNR